MICKLFHQELFVVTKALNSAEFYMWQINGII